MPKTKVAKSSQFCVPEAGDDGSVTLHFGHYLMHEGEEREFVSSDHQVLTRVAAQELLDALPSAMQESATAAHTLANAGGEEVATVDASSVPEDDEAAAAAAAEGDQPGEPPEEDA